MHTVRVSRVLDEPKDRVWAVLDDFGEVWTYNPGVESSRIVNDVETGQGACRECIFYDGGRIEETISDYTPGEGYTVEFTDVGSYPFVSNTVEIRLEGLDDEHTAVTFSAAFQPKYGPLGWLMGRFMMAPEFETRFEAVLDGLAAHLRTGQTVGEDGELFASP